ncbi:MAG TPA: hypothetical protein VFZ48_00900 [Candidatus Saccharimonadales bacterium]
MRLNGHTAAEVQTAVLAATQAFGWRVETTAAVNTGDPTLASARAVLAIFNVKCNGDQYRVTITIQGRGDKQKCVMECWQSTVLGSPCAQDNALYDHYEALGQAIAKAVQ